MTCHEGKNKGRKWEWKRAAITVNEMFQYNPERGEKQFLRRGMSDTVEN